MNTMNMTLAELAGLLDVYGADRSRWPAEARAAAAQLVGKEAAARRLLAEAEALDRVLERAPLPARMLEAALADRIVAAAQRSPRIVKLPDPQPASVPAGGPVEAAAVPFAVGRVGRRPRLRSTEAGAIGLLVASLVFGVVIGRSSLPGQMVFGFADMTGLAVDHDDLVQVALSDEVMQ